MSNSASPIMLQVKGLNKRFGPVHAVKDLNFQVHRGEILGFLGPNGAGKSTTMRIITCFIPSTSGQVLIDSKDNIENSIEVRKKIGYLPESAPLYNDMMVREYLQFVGEIRGLSASKLRSRIDEMFQVCGLTKMATRQIGKLSKGYRQRVGLAQAMIHDPDLLILDEPTSGLDPNQIIEIRNLIKRLGQEKTVIYCSHILPEVSATCSRILIIREGSIVASGTPEELTMRASGSSRYLLRLRADKASVESKLSNVAGISKVEVAASGDWCSATATADTKEDIGEQIFKCVVDNNWSLAELRHETASLEDVFTQLTRG